MTHDPSLSTATPTELAKFAFRAFESGDGLGLAAVTHPTALRSMHRKVIDVMAAGLELERRRQQLDDVPSGGLALLGGSSDLDLLELRGERVEHIPGINTFGELLDLDVAAFFDRVIRAQTEFFKPEQSEDANPVCSYEIGEVEIDGEWATIPYRCTERHSSGHVRTKENVFRARYDGSRWLVWSAPDLIVHWPVFVPPS